MIRIVTGADAEIRQWIGEHLRTTLGAGAVLGFCSTIMWARPELTDTPARYPGLIPRRAAIDWLHGP
jgi:hypothetical protein